MQIKFSESSVKDLERLKEFLMETDPSGIQKVVQRIAGVIDRLASLPNMGYVIDDLPGEIREFVFGRYAIRYQIHLNSLFILRIWHQKEDRL